MLISKPIRTDWVETREALNGRIYWSALLVALSCSLLVLPSRARSQTTASDNGCEKAQTTAAMRTCENARYTTAEQKLEATLNELMRQLDDNQKAKLRLAQSAWLRFREANADFEAGAASGGTLAPLLRITTLADMTEARAAELKKDLQQ